MAETQIDFHQKILDILHGIGIEDWDPYATEREGDAEWIELLKYFKQLGIDDYKPFFEAYKSLLIDPTLSVRDHGTLIGLAITERFRHFEAEARTLRDMPHVNERLREYIDKYLTLLDLMERRPEYSL